MRRLITVMTLLGLAATLEPLQASEATEPQACHAIESAAERLSCYDRATGRPAIDTAPLAGSRPALRRDPLPPRGEVSAPGRSAMVEHWELDDASDGGLLQVRPHQPVYALPARYTTRRNPLPSSPAPDRSVEDRLNLDSVEAKFQLSLKTKALDNILGQDLDLWFGYTQLSSWQAYNGIESSPFRENNYRPEAFLTWGPGLDLFGGWRWQMLNLGIVHESNGRDQPRSRSWNRVYARFGLERGNLAIYARPWWRIEESAGDDDNPDIERFLGSHDLHVVWRRGEHDFGLLTRYSFRGERGGLQADWHFPLIGQLKGYVQLTSGYGETLIDYNHKQTTIGVGVSMVEAR